MIINQTEIAATIAIPILCLIDAMRVHFEWGIKVNITKKVSVILAVILGLTAYFLFPSAKWYLLIPFYIGVRLLLYDPILNIMNRLPINHISTTTNSVTNQAENKLKMTFLEVRGLGIIIIIITLLIQNLWLT